MQPFYEKHIHIDPTFPIIFHLDTIKDSPNNQFRMHWHENVEILYVIQGRAIFNLSSQNVEVQEGDVVIVNSSFLHYAKNITDSCQYYCLIVGKDMCDDFGINVEKLEFDAVIRDKRIEDSYRKIVEEMQYEKPFYKTMVKAEIMSMFGLLSREHVVFRPDGRALEAQKKKMEIVKMAIAYIGEHFCEDLSVEQICRHVGFSKYYFCHTFKEVTNETVIDYLNYRRCSHARKLLSSGQYNVSESAEQSGFHNISYFSKIYRKFIGVLPSEDIPQKENAKETPTRLPEKLQQRYEAICTCPCPGMDEADSMSDCSAAIFERHE